MTAISHTRCPEWAQWQGGHGRRYTLGVEEEAMIFDAADKRLAARGEEVLSRMSGSLREHAGQETSAAVVELRTGVHRRVSRALRELRALRARLSETTAELGMAPACAGTYPLAVGEPVSLSQAPRYRLIARSMRALARRAPTMALHVHVGVPDAEDAIRTMNALRSRLPLLLALSANSPFCEGRDGGFASERTAIFHAFPRTGSPRAFADYGSYVETVEALVGSGAVPDPTFLWWDVRPQPRLGTVEVRVMDAQMETDDTAAIVALVQSLSRMALEDGRDEPDAPPEVLAENCFLAARDGMDALLIDPRRGALRPIAELLAETVERCRPHAARLGCARELALVGGLAARNGAERQRGRLMAGGGLGEVLEMLAESFRPCGPERAGPEAPLPAAAMRRAALGALPA